MSSFFITYGKPHHPASKDTLARWVKEAMREAGINTDIYKPHSTRSASNSKVFSMGVPLKEVLKRGQWSNATTFSVIIIERLKTGYPTTNNNKNNQHEL